MKDSTNGQVYLISHKSSPLLVKIGRTKNWFRRCKDLKVGKATVEELVVDCDNMFLLEKKAHEFFKPYRMPGSEWFVLPDESHKQNVRSYMLSNGKQLIIEGEQIIKKTSKTLSRELYPDSWVSDPSHPKNKQLKDFYEYWYEEFEDLDSESPWVSKVVHEWQYDEGYYLYIDYINPNGEEETMLFISLDVGKIHVYIDGQTCDKTWYHEFMGRDYFDIILRKSKTDEIVYKGVFEFFQFLESISTDFWPTRVKARKFTMEQIRLEMEAKHGPPPSDAELIATFNDITTLKPKSK